jgi:hypothetical protein
MDTTRILYALEFRELAVTRTFVRVSEGVWVQDICLR